MKVERKPLIIAGSIATATFLILFVLAGFFSSSSPCFFCPNISTMALNRAGLYGGPLPTTPICSTTNSAYLSLSLHNPHNIPTSMTGLTLYNSTGAPFANIMAYYMGSTCAQISSTNEPSINGGGNPNMTLYFGSQTASTLTSHLTYDYVMTFANGESISGTLVAQ